MNKLLTVSEVSELIIQGKKLLLAGDQALLEQLPKGHWIGGTIPYFMTEAGGTSTKEKIFVNELPSCSGAITVRTYNEKTIPEIYKNAPGNGFSVIIIPASSPIHQSFALNAPSYDEFAHSPLIGWVSGVHLDDLNSVKPKVFFGETKEAYDDKAVVIHVQLPDNKYCDIDILNIFTQGDNDLITFPENGFEANDAFINGDKKNFAEYINENNLDTRLPLVADYNGAMINISFQSVEEESGRVHFYAPVFTGVEYRQAAPIKDYVSAFTSSMPANSADIVFSCNCILNYLYSELEGKKTADITGPITFGEVAYQLLNQTMVYLTIHDR